MNGCRKEVAVLLVLFLRKVFIMCSWFLSIIPMNGESML